MIAKCRVYAYKTLLTNLNSARNDYVRSNEGMITDNRMMTDMITAPKRHIVTNSYERLNCIILKNKAIISYPPAIEHCSSRTNITRKLIPFSFCCKKFFFTNSIKL